MSIYQTKQEFVGIIWKWWHPKRPINTTLKTAYPVIQFTRWMVKRIRYEYWSFISVSGGYSKPPRKSQSLGCVLLVHSKLLTVGRIQVILLGVSTWYLLQIGVIAERFNDYSLFDVITSSPVTLSYPRDTNKAKA